MLLTVMMHWCVQDSLMKHTRSHVFVYVWTETSLVWEPRNIILLAVRLLRAHYLLESGCTAVSRSLQFSRLDLYIRPISLGGALCFICSFGHLEIWNVDWGGDVGTKQGTRTMD